MAVRAAVSGIDWAHFERVIDRHRVEGLAWEALSRAGVQLDEAWGEGLRRAAGDVALAGLRLAAETGRLQAALDAAGIANLVLKGATLDVLAWGRVGLKRAWDIDLLVAPADASRARATLEAAGYALEDPADSSEAALAAWVELAKESVFVRRSDALVVELHWRLTDAATLLPGLGVDSPNQTVPVSGGLVLRTLADDELFAYLCVHGASHAWSRLKWLADLAAVLARRDEAGQSRLYRRAVALGAGHCPAAALRLCETLFGLALPADIAADLHANRKAARLAALALEALTGGGGISEVASRPFFTERILLSQFLFADGWRYRRAEWARQWVSLDDRMRLKLPRGLGFLYSALRVPLLLRRRLSRWWPRRGRGRH